MLLCIVSEYKRWNEDKRKEEKLAGCGLGRGCAQKNVVVTCFSRPTLHFFSADQSVKILDIS
jgi:hypothetical protein